MKWIQSKYPYLIGFAVGLVMIPFFAIGFNLSWSNAPWLGNLLMSTALIIWPLYVVVVIVLNQTIYKTKPVNQSLWYRSLFIPPLGAVVSLLLVAIVYSLMG